MAHRDPRLTVADPNWSYREMEIRDRKVRRLFDELLLACRPSIICDVGAYDGREAVRLANMLPLAHVVAFEPNPSNVKQFWRDDSLAREASGLHHESLAVSDRAGSGTFHQLIPSEDEPWRDGAGSLLERLDGSPANEVQVEVTTLDRYFGGKHLPSNTLALCVEVEGGAADVLLGATEVLTRTCLVRTQVEREAVWTGQRLAAEVQAMLEEQDFVLLGDTWIQDAYIQSRQLYIRKNVAELIPAASSA